MKNILDDKILKKQSLARKVAFSILQCDENDYKAIEEAIRNHSLNGLKANHEDVQKVLHHIPKKKEDEILDILSALLKK